MKLTFLFALLAVSGIACAADYMFVGTYDKRGKGPWCGDRDMELVPLESPNAYERAKKDFIARYSSQSPATFLLDRNEVAAAFRYWLAVPAFNCQRLIIQIVKAASIEEANARMARIRQGNARQFLSEPEVAFAWHGGAYKTILKRDYSGVEIVLTSAKTAAGTTQVFARGRNANKDKAVSVMYIVGGRLAREPIRLPPGGGFSGPVGLVETFEIEVRFFEADQLATGPADKVVDLARKIIRERITTREGGMKAEALADRG